MEENEKKEIITDAHQMIDTVSDTLKVDGDKAKEYVNILNDSDLKFLKELEELVHMFKKPFWKIVLGIIVVSFVFNLLYQLGYLIGKLIANLGV